MNEQARESCVHKKENVTCTSVASQYADVSVPLNLRPYAAVGKPVTECCGAPSITLHQSPCVGGSRGCEIIITQTVCIRIPVEYGANAFAGETSVICEKNINSAYNCMNNMYRPIT